MTSPTDTPFEPPSLLLPATSSLALRVTLEDLERQLKAEDEPNRPRVPHDERMYAVGRDGARLLNILVRTMGARRVLEVGGSMGYSTMWLAEAVQALGGHLFTLELEPKKITALRARIQQANVQDVVEVIPGDARETLHQLTGPWDLVFIDAWKDDYPFYFDATFPELRVQGALVADNVLYPSPPGAGIAAYLERARGRADAFSQLLPIGNGMELTVRLL